MNMAVNQIKEIVQRDPPQGKRPWRPSQRVPIPPSPCLHGIGERLGEENSTFCDGEGAHSKSQDYRQGAESQEGEGSHTFARDPKGQHSEDSNGTAPSEKIAHVPTVTRKANDGLSLDGLNPSLHRPKYSQLRVGFSFVGTSGEVVEVTALIDTGAEISLVRPGILPESLFTKSSVPLKILGANDQRVGGGTLEIFGHLEASATGFSDREPIKIRFPTRLIQADISVDIILSYEWLSHFKISVRPWRHDLLVETDGLLACIPGLKITNRHTGGSARLQTRAPQETETGATQHAATVSVATSTAAMQNVSDPEQSERPQRVLDLFSGTGSVKKALQTRGWEVVSLDCDPASGADIIQDILTWDFASAFPPCYFDIITASPPCTEFSRALSTRKRQLEEAVKFVERTLRIIHYFQPRLW